MVFGALGRHAFVQASKEQFLFRGRASLCVKFGDKGTAGLPPWSGEIMVFRDSILFHQDGLIVLRQWPLRLVSRNGQSRLFEMKFYVDEIERSGDVYKMSGKSRLMKCIMELRVDADESMVVNALT
jgi:hypothetical protein